MDGVGEPPQLALSAASPAFRGYLADVDARWNVIAGSVDDRTEEERGLKVRPALSHLLNEHINLYSCQPQPLKHNRHRIPKSRYDSVSCYISADARNKQSYNDIPLPIDEETKQRLLHHGETYYKRQEWLQPDVRY
jgi:glutamate--cysteine ligase catalytic subunit